MFSRHRARLVIAVSLCLCCSGFADDYPGEFRLRCLAVTGARIVTPGRPVIERGMILLRDGRIIAVGGDVRVPIDAEELSVAGLTVYPGFLDAGATKLLDGQAQPVVPDAHDEERSRHALAGMRDVSRPGITPDFEAAEHLKPPAEELERYRQSGFTAVHVVPTGRTVSGKSAWLLTDTVPPREALLPVPGVAAFQLIDRGGGEYPSTLMGVMAQLRQAFLDAERRQRQREILSKNTPGVPPLTNDPILDGLLAVQQQQVASLWSVTTRDDVERTLRFAREFGIKPALWGGRDAVDLLDQLRDPPLDLVLQVDFGDEPKIDASEPKEISTDTVKDLPKPLRVQEDQQQAWKKRVSGPSALRQAGLRITFSSRGVNAPAEVLKGVRQAIDAGLSAEAALAALTSDAADMLGLGDQLGRIEPGRLGCLTIMTGPLENSESKVRHVILPGKRYEYNRDAKPLAAPASPAAPQASVAGRWAVTIDGAVSAQLHLDQHDQKLQGTFASEAGNGKVISEEVSESSLKFTVAIGAGEKSVDLKFEGRLADGKLSGTVKSPFGAAANWQAEREPEPPLASRAAPSALVQLEKPELEPADASPTPSGLATELVADRLHRFTPPPASSLLIRHGTILTATGRTIKHGSILVRDGRIVDLGPDEEVAERLVADALHPGEPRIIEATNRFVIPGLIDTHSHIMIGSSTGLGGVNEFTDSIVCEVRIKDVINTADPAEYRALAGGVTTARLLHGSANVIGGQDAVVQLKYGRTAAEHLLPDAPQGVKFALGENVKARSGRFPNTRLGVEATLRRAFVEALEYRKQWQEFQKKCDAVGAAAAGLPPRRDLRLEALAGILNQQMFIHSHCYRADEILMLLRVASHHGIRVWSLQHVLEGYKVAPEIVAHGASCSTFADWWAYKVEAYDATPHNAALLHEAGANTVIKSDDHELIRHLPLEAAKTIRYGSMPPDAALQTVTLNSARELGLSDRIGSIEIGKQADFAIFNGHPFSPFSRCEMTIIAGQVEFVRERQPTAMSAEAVERTAIAPPLELPARTPDTEDEFLASSRLLSVLDAPRYALVGATLHPVDAADILNGTLLIEDGVIRALGSEVPLPENCPTVSLAGLHVYPGLIDAGTTLGLVEIGKVRETHDFAEAGQFQPDLRAGVAINPDSELIPVARAGGITAMHVRPVGGIISGQTSIAQLAGWTVPDLLLVESAGLQVNWPNGDKRQESIDELRRFLKVGRIYDRVRTAMSSQESRVESQEPESQSRKSRDESQKPENAEDSSLTLDYSLTIDARFEALRPFVRGEKSVHIEADSRQQIVEAVQFAKEESLKIVITGGTDAWKVAALLKEREVPVIVGPTMKHPVEDYDPFDATYANPGRLWEAGVRFCIRSNNASNSRNAPFEAAIAVAYGLPEAEALKSVTLSSAEILGVADRIGSLTPGKRADVIITDGSPLITTSQVRGVIIAGRPFAPESRQTKLAEKYRERIKSTRK